MNIKSKFFYKAFCLLYEKIESLNICRAVSSILCMRPKRPEPIHPGLQELELAWNAMCNEEQSLPLFVLPDSTTEKTKLSLVKQGELKESIPNTNDVQHA